MKTQVEKINDSRRGIIKKATSVAGILMTSGITSNVQAQTPNGNFNSSKVESKYIPKPKQVPVTEGVLPLPLGAGLYYWDTGGEGPVVLLSHPGEVVR
ncbi:hypothetical protein [Pseudoalteromonas sp. C2R02]|uniref:hypothetical protein n=1 Tax=Pseudoalteromonas sp. C2R02 TaxID=2841565 RepID=UPI002091DFFA|nr:hypothetical protein [Pseudoalteromonas sp. C2R02]